MEFDEQRDKELEITGGPARDPRSDRSGTNPVIAIVLALNVVAFVLGLAFGGMLNGEPNVAQLVAEGCTVNLVVDTIGRPDQVDIVEQNILRMGEERNDYVQIGRVSMDENNDRITAIAAACPDKSADRMEGV